MGFRNPRRLHKGPRGLFLRTAPDGARPLSSKIKAILRWICIALAVLALLAGAAGEAANWLAAFSGEVCVPLGRQERVVVREAVPQSKTARRIPLLAPPVDIQRSLAPDAVPFERREDAAGLLQPDRTYDAVRLPFAIRLKQVKVLRESEPRDSITISEPGSEKVSDIAPESVVQINSENYRVESIRPWSGLLRNSAGTPMAAVSLREPAKPWTENLFLSTGTWRRVEPGIALRLIWLPTESAARDALDTGLPGMESARWGVVDGPAVHWFASFEPGTGAQLANGSAVSLLRVDDAHPTESGPRPAIEIQFEEPGRTRAMWVVANAAASDDPFRFEYCARLETVILLYAFQDSAAWATAFHKGNSCGTRKLSDGDSWRPENVPYEIRLDQAIEKALPVIPDDSVVYEAVLAGPGQTIRLRQGEAVRVGDARLRFSRKTDPPRVRYDLAAIDDDTGRERAFSVSPDDSTRFRDWRFSQGTPTGEPLRTAVLRAEHVSVNSGLRILMGVALAALVWLIMIARPKSPASR